MQRLTGRCMPLESACADVWACSSGDDVDVEAIVDNMMEIQREIGLKMYEYGWYFAKGGDGIHKV